MNSLSKKARKLVHAARTCDNPTTADARRVRTHILAKLGVVVSLLSAFVSACSDTPSNTPETRASGGNAGNSLAGNGASGGNAGATNIAGTSNAGSGGTNSAGGAGSAGATSGQSDPGTEGDGTFDHPEPYPAAPETLSRIDGAPEGSVSASARYASELYGYEFEHWIYVPSQYRPEKPAALMVFQDGVHYLGQSEAKFNSKNTFDNLIHQGDMPVTIGLFINPGNQRSVEYDSIDDKYSKFLLDEIIPDVITSKYNIVNDPDAWAIGGHSSGGICAFTVAWQRPDKFRKVLTHNGSFVDIRGGDAYPQLIRDTTPAKPLRVYLLSGTKDIVNGAGNWHEANGLMADALAEKSYHYRYLSGTGAHYPPVQSVADYPAALRWLWRGYRLPE